MKTTTNKKNVTTFTAINKQSLKAIKGGDGRKSAPTIFWVI